MKTVEIYTDGACSGNPGPGGWGAILRYAGREKELSGAESMTTNNRMELLGVITALEALREPCVVELYSDSKYVIDALDKGWAVKWKKNGWKKGCSRSRKSTSCTITGSRVTPKTLITTAATRWPSRRGSAL